MGGCAARGPAGSSTGAAGKPADESWTPDERVPERPDFPRLAVREALAAERRAPAERVFTGTTHRNTVVYVESVGFPVVVRRRAGGARRLERGVLSEHAVLAAIEHSGLPVRAPRVLALGTDHGTGPEGRFAVHSYAGPGGSGAPQHPVDGLLPREADDVVAQLCALTRVDHRPLGPGADGADFYPRLCDELASLVERLPSATRRRAAERGLPDGRLLREILAGHRVSRRSPALLHGDLNPWNLVRAARPGGGLALIDWEMARIGDPLYDLVRHLHLTSAPLPVRTRMLDAWQRALPEHSTHGWVRDAKLYRSVEIVRSAYVDLDRLVNHEALDVPHVRRAVASYEETKDAALAFLRLPAGPSTWPGDEDPAERTTAGAAVTG